MHWCFRLNSVVGYINGTLDCVDGPLLRGNDNVQTKMHSDNSITFALGGSGAAVELY